MNQPPNTGLFKKIGSAAAILVVAGSVAAVPVIKKWEGRSLTPYYDIAGVLTYCDGETLHADSKKIYTDHECDDLTAQRAIEFGTFVASKLEVQVPQKVFKSYVINSYNIGMQAFADSTTLREANKGNIAQSCEAMMKFVCYTAPKGVSGDTKPTLYAPTTSKKPQLFKNCVRPPAMRKKFSKGLANRRDEERAICLEGANEDGHG